MSNLVVNGNFDAYTVSTNSFTYFDKQSGGVTFSTVGLQTSTNYVSSVFPNWIVNSVSAAGSNAIALGNGSSGFGSNYPGIPQFLIVQQRASNANLQISQSMNLISCASNALTFAVSVRSGNSTTAQQMTVGIAGVLSTQTVSLTNSWNIITFPFTVSSNGTYTLLFTFTSSAGVTDNSIFLTKINVNQYTYPCFLQGTKILCMNTETDEEEYVPVEKLRRGDLVKTFSNGYKAIELIGSRKIPNPLAIEKESSKLYWLRKSKISRLREDLCVTGDHCILHKSITDEKKKEVFDYMRDIYITEDHYRVPAFLDDRSEPYEEPEPVTIWHFALENPNIYHNYGVMANGLLVESSSIHYMYLYSNMDLI